MDYYIQVIIKGQCRKIENLGEPESGIPASLKYIYYRNLVIKLLNLNEIDSQNIQEIKYKKLKKKRPIIQFNYSNYIEDSKLMLDIYRFIGK